MKTVKKKKDNSNNKIYTIRINLNKWNDALTDSSWADIAHFCYNRSSSTMLVEGLREGKLSVAEKQRSYAYHLLLWARPITEMNQDSVSSSEKCTVSKHVCQRRNYLDKGQNM
jgi:hypothetical protein